MFLSIIIPCYNEEKSIKKTLLALNNYLTPQNYDYEILAANDGSRDNTAQVVRQLASSIKGLRLLDNAQNHGKGWAVRQGMLQAKGEIRLFMDADNATDISHFEKMIPFFERNCEVVIGSRDKKDAPGATQAVPQSFLKRQLGNFGNFLIQIVAVWGIWDTQCGFKAFKAPAAQKIFSLCRIDRWGFDIEALALAKKFGFKIGIIPVYWINNPQSRVNLSGYLKTFVELFQIKWNLISGKYHIK